MKLAGLVLKLLDVNLKSLLSGKKCNIVDISIILNKDYEFNLLIIFIFIFLFKIHIMLSKKNRNSIF